MKTVLTPRDLAECLEAVAKKRDRSSFAKLFDYYAPRLNSYLQRMGINAAIAEEIIQDVMVTIWKKSELFDIKKSSVSTWIYRIARNRSIDILRNNKMEFLDFDTNEMDIELESNETDQYLIEQEEYVRKALDLLPPDQLELVKLSFFEGLSHNEIAVRTGIPLGTVKSRIRLGFARLKKEILEKPQ